jgi:hypothetical protein
VPSQKAPQGLTPETIQRYGLGLCRRGVLKGYVAIPVYGYPSKPDDLPLAYLGRWPGEDYDEPPASRAMSGRMGFPRQHQAAKATGVKGSRCTKAS